MIAKLGNVECFPEGKLVEVLDVGKGDVKVRPSVSIRPCTRASKMKVSLGQGLKPMERVGVAIFVGSRLTIRSVGRYFATPTGKLKTAACNYRFYTKTIT